MIHTANRWAHAAWLILLLALAGCASPLLQTPHAFLRLEGHEKEYDYRATTADGIVLAGRVLAYDKSLGGGVSFWVDAIKLRLQATGGYALLKEQSIQTTRGLQGKQLRFGHDEKRGAYQYWVTVFVSGSKVVVLECGGPESNLGAHEAAIMQALASVNP
jgi:hypothetical protein